MHYWFLLDSQLFAVLLPLFVMDGREYVLIVAVCCRVLQSIVACSCLLMLLLLLTACVCNGLPFAVGFAQHAGVAAIRCPMRTFCDRLCFALFAKIRMSMRNADFMFTKRMFCIAVAECIVPATQNAQNVNKPNVFLKFMF